MDHASPPPLPQATPTTAASKPVAGFLFDWLMGVLIAFALMLVGGVVWGFVRAFQLGLQQAQRGASADPQAIAQALGTPSGTALLAMTLFSMAPAAVLMYYWRRRASAAERAASRTAAGRASTWAWTLPVAVAVAVSTTLLLHLADYLGIGADPSNEGMIRQLWGHNRGLLVVFVVVLAPLYEELFFRRVLFGRLWQAGRPWLGMALSGLAFALAHEVPGTGNNSWQATLFLLLVYAGMGATFAWLYRRTGTLWAPIAAHAINNGLAIALLALSAQ
ncbi:CPBP family intramembrane glutamic endopeptidase [Pseudoxanthomonas dokdonensis]|uniref:CAAX prenyl protease 2/Lysostaphin resistance protein A-like domain-containing protein n=1 Tax=Pseudoxanthomonas dokdonensis TaxID=344882 RepID=A0A0R0CZM9_9GAMM|nr:CPBP family intramembrane glutamic endopeptidase [Pseudoxanthomonas dokdonensis]KRG72050.1 hypothetical protein ABB29_00890 [Pseudoxanthomonas dokdonensis]